MVSLGDFDANNVEPLPGFDPIPAGRYEVVVVASDLKPTKAGDGQYLELELEIASGEYKGRKLWDRLTLSHPNELTVKIARAKLSAVCRACGVLQPKDSTDLHNLPITAKVKTKKRPDTSELVNEVGTYEKREVANGQPAQATTTAPPWRRN